LLRIALDQAARSPDPPLKPNQPNHSSPVPTHRKRSDSAPMVFPRPVMILLIALQASLPDAMDL
jgi:hypothetical protein